MNGRTLRQAASKRSRCSYLELIARHRGDHFDAYYLGLVHRTDGLDGARRRLAAAKKVVTDFGIATECGFG